jgi:hypothetical protein
VNEVVTMNCYTFEQILHDLDRPGTAGSSLREAALAHAESCTSCALLLIEAEALDFGLRTLASQDANREAPRRVEAALLREFREHHAAPVAIPRSRAFEWYAGVIGVAAMALLALGIARFHLNSLPAQPSRTAVVTSNPTASTPTNEAVSVSGAQSAQTDSANAADAAGSEEATEFYPLPYADDSASLEGGAVIRVAMPRSTLASWGFPVSGLAATDRIPADLVVSADGTPQAIRLVAAND